MYLPPAQIGAEEAAIVQAVAPLVWILLLSILLVLLLAGLLGLIALLLALKTERFWSPVLFGMVAALSTVPVFLLLFFGNAERGLAMRLALLPLSVLLVAIFAVCVRLVRWPRSAWRVFD